ncbi:MAG: hypothetical protein ABI220_00295 [Candidatus Saccharimonadales bacterium]
MKQTVVPAQITTVEDRVAGSLGLSQLVLLASPVFGGSALFVVLPPVFHGAVYKLVIIGILSLICSLLAIRIKGKILLLWLIILLRYNLRPAYYLFNKNTTVNRQQYQTVELEAVAVEVDKTDQRKLSNLSTADTVRVLEAIAKPEAHLMFETNKKGKLYVHITEVQPES